MVAALNNFSIYGEYLFTSCLKKLLKMEFQVLADIVAKATMIAGIFDRLAKEKGS